MLKRSFIKSGQGLTLVLAGGLVVWLLVAMIQSMLTELPAITGVTISLIAVLSLVLLIGIWGLARLLARRQTSGVILTFTFLTLIKLPIVALLKITPTSDFWSYHALAAYSAQGMTWKTMAATGRLGTYVIFPHALNIANFFSLGAAFGGTNFFISQLINISSTWLDMLLLYWLGSRWFSREVGITAGLLFYGIPAYWLYSTLLNGAEPLFLTFVLVAMLALTKALFPLKTATPSDQWLNLGLAWLATLAANMLRPIMLVFILALIILSLWLWIQNLTLKRHLRQLIIYIVATILLIGCSPVVYNWLYGVQLAPTRVSTAYSLATGTDSHSAGQYDPAIMHQVTTKLKNKTEPNQAYPKLASTLQTDTQQHLQELTKQGRWGAFINVKTQNLMSAAYGYNWTLYNLNLKQSQQQINRHWYQLRGPIILLSFDYLGLLLVGALISILIGLWTLFSSNNYRSANCFFFETLLLIGLTISTLCLEVQGRYQIVLYIPIIMLIGTGLAAIKAHQPDNKKSNN